MIGYCNWTGNLDTKTNAIYNPLFIWYPLSTTGAGGDQHVRDRGLRGECKARGGSTDPAGQGGGGL